MILFTSGSTGDPKGVMLSHRNLLANAASILAYLPVCSDDRTLAVLPFCYAYGNSVLQTHVLAGASLILGESPTFPVSICRALRDFRATSMSAVPEIYSMLLRFAQLGLRSLPDLRYLTVAGGALGPEQVQVVARRIAPAKFYVMYGQSEATARLSYLPPDQLAERGDSIGRGIPGVTLRVADESGQAVQPGEVGTLFARGENVMRGYWNDPQATAQAVRDGWLNTGDLATVDEEGYVYLRGRENLLVKVQGHRVHPREVEEFVTQSFPGSEVAVVAHEIAGQTRLGMFVVAAAERAMTADEVRACCVRHLPRYKVPSHVEMVRQLPLNTARKIDRQALGQRLVSQNRRAA
jgi:acyl-CoA synthetase (AMP-forming)/AMP-acid ligase II